MKNIIFNTKYQALLITVIIIITIILTPAVYAQSATLSLSPSTGTFNKGCTFTLDVMLNTGGVQTDGTDAIVIYDTSRVLATSIAQGSIYPDYPGSNIDEQGGKITISGLASVTTPFSGQGKLATVNFKVLDNAPSGATQIKFDFDANDKAKTTDSNVVERGTVADILNSVVNGSYTVGTGSCVAPSPSPGVVGPGKGAPGVSTPSATPSTLDQLVDKHGFGPGTPQLTYTITIVGVVLVILGILGLALI